MIVNWYRMIVFSLAATFALLILLVFGLEMAHSQGPINLIALEKTVSPFPEPCSTDQVITVLPYTKVTYCYLMHNTNNFTLTTHSLFDSELGIIEEMLQADVPPGGSLLLTATAIIQGTTINTATWVSDQASVGVATATVIIQDQGIMSLRKTVSPTPNLCGPTQIITVTPNTSVTYCYRLDNTSNFTLTRHSLFDNELGWLADDLFAEVPPGGNLLLTATAVLTETTINTATWAVNGDFGPIATDIASATVVVQEQAQNIALIGEASQVISVAAPFINNSQLKLLRTYPNALGYYEESPVLYFPTLPPNLAISLYEIPFPLAQTGNVLDAIVQAAAANNVAVEYKVLDWLTYIPKQLMLTGPCENITQLVGNFPGLGSPPEVIDLTFTAVITSPTPCLDNQQIHLYPIMDGQKVAAYIDMVKEMTTTITAEPNRFIVGSSQDYIAGSPGGPLRPQAVPWPISEPGGSGENVRILIFDTVPFTIAAGQTIQESYKNIPLTASYPFPLPIDLPEGGQSAAAHGTFVASAAMDMTPDAEYHLIKVLNNEALGEEFTFFLAAEQAIEASLAVSQSLAGVVMNYSFVSELTPTLSTPAMSAFLSSVHDLNITQVAASGNNSANASTPFPMRYPAQHETVLGITAVTWDANYLSCFANQGELAVWAGGTRRGLGSCNPTVIATQCASGAHPEYCVIGWDPNSPTNYAYGLGTSFAAPLIAGLAAQEIATETTTLGNWPSPALIRTNLYEHVTHNPDPANIEIGAIKNPYVVSFKLYLPAMIKP